MFALNEFIKTNKEKIPNYEKGVIAYVNKINEKVEDYVTLDTDNYKYKAITNILAANFLKDDSYDIVSTFHTSQKDKFSSSEAYIIPAESFTIWLKNNYEI